MVVRSLILIMTVSMMKKINALPYRVLPVTRDVQFRILIKMVSMMRKINVLPFREWPAIRVARSQIPMVMV
jgi:Tfp pilus assembly protein PilN